MTKQAPSVQRPGITETTLIAAGVCFSDYPEPGSIEIPYWTPEGDITRFKRWRLPAIRHDGQKYYQEPGSGVYVYFPPGFFPHRHTNGSINLPEHSVVLNEGEFKELSLQELGIYTLGLPSFNVYIRDNETNQRRLLLDLQRTFSKEKIEVIYFLGDADTATNFEFARQAAFLASATHPAKVLLPRIPLDHPKGIDDCKEKLGAGFLNFFATLINEAIRLPRKCDPVQIALLILEREAERLKALQGPERERHFKRIIELCIAAGGSSQAAARLHKLSRSILGLNAAEFKAALGEQQRERRASRPKKEDGESKPAEDHDGVSLSWPAKEQRPCFGVYVEAQRVGNKIHKPGVYRHDVLKSETKTEVADDWICAPVRALARTANRDDSEHGILLVFTSTTGKEKKWAMPMRLLLRDGQELKAYLLDAGLRIDHAQQKHIPRYIAACEPREFLACATHTGWHNEESFVFPDEVIGKGGVWFQCTQRVALYRRGGDFDSWKRLIAQRACNNPNLMFTIAYSLCGPLLKWLELPGAGIHWMGDSTIGKTTAIVCGASSWGDHEYIRGWRNTSNGLEGAAEQHSDTLLALDEIREIDPRELYQVIDFLMNGRGKGRANTSGEGRPVKHWRVALLSSGEISVQGHLAEAGISIKAGQELRILSVPVQGKFGLFDDLHGTDSASEFSDLLRRDANRHYGHAGPAFVRSIVDNPSSGSFERLAEILKSFGGSGAQELRGARTFALAALAGELAVEAGILPWAKGEATGAAKTVFTRWRDARAINSPGSTERRVLDTVAAFIDAHGESRFSPLDRESYDNQLTRTINRAGYWSDELIDTAQVRLYLLSSGALKEATKGIDFDVVLQALDEAGALAKKDSGRKSFPARTPRDGLQRFYWVNPNKL